MFSFKKKKIILKVWNKMKMKGAIAISVKPVMALARRCLLRAAEPGAEPPMGPGHCALLGPGPQRSRPRRQGFAPWFVLCLPFPPRYGLGPALQPPPPCLG